jgi:ElaB/YqjD/DUF883 family membrane-anchored ribosome-binding protein
MYSGGLQHGFGAALIGSDGDGQFVGWNQPPALLLSGRKPRRIVMADESKPEKPENPVQFDADPTLAAKAGSGGKPANVQFDADPNATSSGASVIGQNWRDEASKFAQQAGERARTLADESKARATDALSEFSKMMNDAAGSVDEKLGPDYGKYARSAADSLAGFADTLKGKEVDELLDDARELIRKSPAIAIGTAAALGFVLARLVKSGVDAAADMAETAGKKSDA